MPHTGQMGMAESNDAPDNRYRIQMNLIEKWRDEGKMPEADAERLLDFGRAICEEEAYPVFQRNGENDTKTAATSYTYLQRLRVDIYGKTDDMSLLDITADEFNRHMSKLDADRARGTTRSSQSAAKCYFHYHDDLGIEEEEIAIFDPEDNSAVDPEKVLKPHEVDELRKAIDQSRNPIRNRALLEILVWTGQRFRAIHSLKLKHVHADEKPGYIMLNTDASGLKGAEERGRRRPLLGARKAVRDWINRHPKRDDPEAWLFCGSPSHPRSDVEKQLSYEAFRYTLKKAAKEAGINPKRVTPHKLRHFFVTNLRKNHDHISWDEILALGGWSEESNTPKTVYKHISGEEYQEKVEKKLGFRDQEEEDDKTVQRPCDICGEIIKPHKWTECPNCKEPLAPGETTEEKITDDMIAGLLEAEGDEKEGIKSLNELLQSEEVRTFIQAVAQKQMSDDDNDESASPAIATDD